MLLRDGPATAVAPTHGTAENAGKLATRVRARPVRRGLLRRRRASHRAFGEKPQSEANRHGEEILLVTDFGEGIGCPGELGGGSAILTSSARIISSDHPQGGRHAERRALVPARAGAEDHLHPLFTAAV